ncbi:glycosyl hydrolase family 18 protein [Escherichia coli]|uniref:carbohydrate-binding protein n=1 Tax=Escherichia coli TaxID=562 RepID=UPI000BE2AAEC|nr:carbohydrate-binding protein [Escherichia coli]MCF7301244.1 glycosyl hydrolase family 18 protein [Escherichia coli]MCF7343223.1 glycosyl hydrolase family 18 protein [Escherichia coli]MCN1781953.1 glycosyl hydrolase family 18 protein [Escherichia coli]MCN2940109.1 glycosyl hydrolase family 18 protein [Escherichia coli]MCN4375676.1 glycosyl hydrolase family 18 protein [Escherichia coli]
MKLNIFTKSMIGMGLVCSALPALAMEAWNNQQGGNKYQVIFDGKIYENAWWVSSTNCPGKAKANDATNPWRLKRTATAAEISQFGNTLSCEKSGSSSSSTSNTPASNTPANGASATPAQGTVPSNSSVVAWNKQQGGQTWYVVFNGAVYKNAWWVASSNCPGDAKGNDASNPWRYVRAATATEITQYGNPASCSVKPDNNGGAVTPVDPTPETPETPVTPTPDNNEPSTPADSSNDYSLQAWSGQEGSEIYHVIFNGNVYQNAWWVGSEDCPRGTSVENSNNPWRLVRTATAAEMSQYGNPTTCEIDNGGVIIADGFQASKAYSANSIVDYNDAHYKTSVDQDAWGFVPGGDNPWKKYEPAKAWSASTVYVKGDRVVVDGQAYEALFWTQSDNPALIANQNATGSNSRPWKPLGKTQSYSNEELNNAPQFNPETLYASDTLIRFNGENYISQSKVQKVSPSDSNPWRVFVDWTGTKERVGTPKKAWPKHVYAPYVDFTLNTIPDLAALAKSHNVNHFTLAFVVSKDANTCLPTWGTAYGMQNYAQYSKIKALREAGGDVMLSIGGANNAPLAASCKNVDDLMQHYYDIVDNLNLRVLDFDIEGTWVADQASIERRNLAVKKVQDKWKSEGKDIAIWYTLPILPTGLTPEGMNVLSDAKAKGVELAGVNVMTMDYGNAICQSANTEGQNIHGKCATSAIANLHSQLKGLHPNKSDAEIDAMMGTTPMVGVNDVQGEVFYLSDARLVMQDAQKRNLGMVGIWSIARDLPGGTNLSPEFHGLTKEQAPKYAFSEIFAPFTKQ